VPYRLCPYRLAPDNSMLMVPQTWTAQVRATVDAESGETRSPMDAISQRRTFLNLPDVSIFRLRLPTQDYVANLCKNNRPKVDRPKISA
jgi:hypothetical protein